MYSLKRKKSFVKDLSKVKMSDKQYSKYISYVSTLINGLKLPVSAKDHSLSGEYRDTREFIIHTMNLPEVNLM